MENPYASPPPAFDTYGQAAPDGTYRQRGLIGHVRVLGILMMIQGVLGLLMGVALIGLGVFVGVMFVNEGGGPGFPRNQNQPPPEVFGWILGVVYGGMGLLMMIVGGVTGYSGWRTFQFRSRTLAIVSLCTGLLSVFTCYCAPTGIALMIYGLIVMLNPSVRDGFALGEQGLTADQIDAAFNPYATPPR